MKYMVMECHDSHAVLMDEESRFVIAANLRYKVGDTVTDPIIMNDPAPAANGIKMYITRVAAAACIALIAAGGYSYYSSNFKTHSTIIISSEANITMELNKKGKVLSLKSSSDSGKEILKDYSGKGKDSSTVTKEILKIEKDKGYISDGDTVEMYVLSEDDSAVSDRISDIESNVNDNDIKINVKDIKDYESPHIKANTVPTEPTLPTAPAAPAAPAAPVTPPVPKAEEKIPEIKLPEEKLPEPTAPTVNEPEKKAPAAEQHRNENANKNKEDRKEQEKKEPAAPPAVIEAPEPEKPAEITPPEPEKPAVEHTPNAPDENNNRHDPPRPSHEHNDEREKNENENRNVIHRSHEGFPEIAHPIPDTNSIENVSPDLNEP